MVIGVSHFVTKRFQNFIVFVTAICTFITCNTLRAAGGIKSESLFVVVRTSLAAVSTFVFIVVAVFA